VSIEAAAGLPRSTSGQHGAQASTQHRKSTANVVLAVAGGLVLLALVVWAVLQSPRAAPRHLKR
jgi:hypothetical protein